MTNGVRAARLILVEDVCVRITVGQLIKHTIYLCQQ